MLLRFLARPCRRIALRRGQGGETRALVGHSPVRVAHGNVISSAGVSAAIRALAGLGGGHWWHRRAARPATRLGATGWSNGQDSHNFPIDMDTVLTWVGNRYLKGSEHFVVPVANGVDDIAPALTLDAHGRTMRSPTLIRTALDARVCSSHGLRYRLFRRPGTWRASYRCGKVRP